MRIGILGTGTVGKTLATKLVKLGNDVRMGSRKSGGEKAKGWLKEAGGKSSEGTFADAAAHAEIVFNCTAGMASLDALRAAGAQNLQGKVLIDVSNPLDFSRGMPPTNFRLQHRLTRRADPEGVSRGEGRKDVEHGDGGADGRPVDHPWRSHDVRLGK